MTPPVELLQADLPASRYLRQPRTRNHHVGNDLSLLRRRPKPPVARPSPTSNSANITLRIIRNIKHRDRPKPSASGRTTIFRRTAKEGRQSYAYAVAKQGKSLTSMLLIDFEEEYEQKKISLSDMPKVLEAVLQVACGAANIPVRRLLGKSPGGLGSNGHGEIRYYYDTLSSRQESELRPGLERLDRALKRHACGATPDSLDYEWVPLRGLSDAEKAAVAVQQAQAAQIWVATGLLPFEALANGVQSLIVREATYPAFEEAMLTALPVQAPEASPDGSQVKNPATLTKAATASGDE